MIDHESRIRIKMFMGTIFNVTLHIFDGDGNWRLYEVGRWTTIYATDKAPGIIY